MPEFAKPVFVIFRSERLYSRSEYYDDETVDLIDAAATFNAAKRVMKVAASVRDPKFSFEWDENRAGKTLLIAHKTDFYGNECTVTYYYKLVSCWHEEGVKKPLLFFSRKLYSIL